LNKFAAILREGRESMYLHLVSHWHEPGELVRHSREVHTRLWDDTMQRYYPDDIDRMQFLDILTYLPDDILTKVDRASMAVSLEAPVPLVSVPEVSFGLRVWSFAGIRWGYDGCDGLTEGRKNSLSFGFCLATKAGQSVEADQDAQNGHGAHDQADHRQDQTGFTLRRFGIALRRFGITLRRVFGRTATRSPRNSAIARALSRSSLVILTTSASLTPVKAHI